MTTLHAMQQAQQAIQANLDTLREYDALFDDDAFLPIRDIAIPLIVSATFALETEAVRLDTSADSYALKPVCEDQLQRLSILAQYPTLTPEFAQTIFVQLAANGELGSIRMLRELGLITIDDKILYHPAIEEAVKNGHAHIFRELIVSIDCDLRATCCARVRFLFKQSVTLETMEIVYKFFVNAYSRRWGMKEAKRKINVYLLMTCSIEEKIDSAINEQNAPKLRFLLMNWKASLRQETFLTICQTNNIEMITTACDVIWTPRFHPKEPYFIRACEHGCLPAVREFIQKLQELPVQLRYWPGLIAAIQNNHPEILRALLSTKNIGKIQTFNPNFKNNIAIRTAIHHKATDCIRELSEFSHYIENKALVTACARGEVETVRALLTDPEIDPSAFRNKALRMAVKSVTHATTDIVRLLVEDPRFQVTSAVDHCIYLATGHNALGELLGAVRMTRK